MISKITLFNFQFWEKLEVELDPLLTVLVGPSRKGKSSIIRAMRWLFLNKSPRGQFIKFGEEVASVHAELEGVHLCRNKGKDINSYFMDEQHYQAMGRENVPKPIEEFLGMGEENFQKQLDSHFWFSETPGQISKNLNKIVNLEVIDKSLSEIRSLVKKSKLAIELSTEKIAELRVRKRRLKPVLKLAAQMAQIRRLANSVDQKRETLHLLIAMSKNIEILEVKKRTLENKLSLLEKIDFAGLEKLSAKVTAKKHELRELQQALARIDNLKRAICEREKSIRSAENSLGKLSKGKRCPTCGRPLPKKLRTLSG